MTARPAARSTCPWGDNGQKDVDTTSFEAAARKRAAKGEGKGGCYEAARVPNARLGTGASGTSSRHGRPSSGEENAKQMQEFVQQCLDQGYGEEEIEGLWQQYRRQNRPQSTAVLSQATPAHPSSMAAHAGRAKETSGASIQSYDEAKSRQAYMQGHKEAAEAKKKNAAGPGLLSHMLSEPDSRAVGRQKAKESSDASVQSYDEARSRQAYLQGQKEALESKRKNAAGLGFF
eukprot:TRINITY_DN34170_c0_g1_i1.p1 TRINITY_DN34170_c0_g1~~TRINITY_DN34170_c0_g1_i1.p1  ORF type:complete len:232 (+),score=43.93 TRINITY_DN34170_c0_g1_i1:50-745(+)